MAINSVMSHPPRRSPSDSQKLMGKCWAELSWTVRPSFFFLSFLPFFSFFFMCGNAHTQTHNDKLTTRAIKSRCCYSILLCGAQFWTTFNGKRLSRSSCSRRRLLCCWRVGFTGRDKPSRLSCRTLMKGQRKSAVWGRCGGNCVCDPNSMKQIRFLLIHHLAANRLYTDWSLRSCLRFEQLLWISKERERES